MTGASPESRHLFRRFPGLIGELPWMELADLPSPVARLESLGRELGASQLWIKRDDLNSPVYAGNKARKFEFIFAEAAAMGRREIVTMGSAGSNHAAATSLFCRHLGLQPVLALTPQPVLTYARNNILINSTCGARYLISPNEVVAVIRILLAQIGARLRGRTPPYFMFFGGSSLAGNVAYVDAGLELAAQVSAGELPEPRYLFVTTGSCGTHAGLLVGLRLAGLATEVIGVRIVPRLVTNRFVVAWHANRVARYLRRLDPAFPRIRIKASEVRLLHAFYGGQYARPTSEGKAAIELLARTEKMPLDPTYTGKTFAGMLHFIREQGIEDEPVLFWQTLNGTSLDEHLPAEVPHNLPKALRAYFEQPLYDPDL